MLEYHKSSLANKLDIYTIEVNKASEVISVDIFYKVGSRDENIGSSGIAHMLEHLNFKSSKNLAAGEFDKIIKDFGGVDNASTGFDYTHYYIKCHKDNLEKCLELFAELMSNLNLKEDEFLKERDVVLEERLWRTDNSPLGYLFFALYNNAFLYHPYHWTPIGFTQDIKNWTIADIKAFHERFYRPDNAFLIISGAVDKSAHDLAKKYFEHIPNKKSLKSRPFIEEAQLGERFAVINKPSKNELLALGFKIPSFNHPDMPALQALGEYLGAGKSAKLSEILIDKLNLINDFYSYASENKDPNLFVFICTCNEGVSASLVKEQLLLIINDLKQNPISDFCLEKIKNNCKTDMIFAQDSASKVSSLYGSYIAKGDLDVLKNYDFFIDKLTPKDLQAVAKKYFCKEKSTCIILKGGEDDKD